MKYYYVEDCEIIIDENEYRKGEQANEFDFIPVMDNLELDREQHGFSIFKREFEDKNEYWYISIFDSELNCYHTIWAFEEDNNSYLNPNFIDMFGTLNRYLQAENIRRKVYEHNKAL